MVLATCDDKTPWIAPVYFVFHKGVFYFFSSPRSEHSKQLAQNQAAAGSIFHDSEQWENIQGIQMSGHVKEVCSAATFAAATARYLVRHPFARAFLSETADSMLDLRNKVSLYGLSPDAVYFVNNRNAFGNRVRIEL